MRIPYVVLRHTLPDGAFHFDLLLDVEPTSPLLTFQFTQWPPIAEEPPKRLPDHRREYLTYVGEVSGGRGVVERVTAGECEVSDDLLTIGGIEVRL